LGRGGRESGGSVIWRKRLHDFGWSGGGRRGVGESGTGVWCVRR
jgi:hypothetical protein